MNRRKKFITPKQFFEVEHDKKNKAMEEVEKVVKQEDQKEKEHFKEVSK